ncbi:hypothetical protein PRUPE_4G288100 [Prunus persica]|uniref:N-lysine methyltransferase n=1 Tax=Prunus persica TaxID=3760 RepID=A0A251PSN9_PRUPE|nr:ribosomal lysine N-methyltransferase 3 isoform X1 [Prunus persica]ONI14599.1 hypothetical protein PRUPE_4G288100 [Prunus persica]ONI14600.1 hypothetical protein PRUPE_4G288100 [Prunus persica]
MGKGSSRRVRAFKRWMKREGIECSDALDLRDEGVEIGISVSALAHLKEGDVVARIPKLTCLTTRTTAARDIISAAAAGEGEEESCLGGLAGLAVALMYERSLGERSRWAPYLELLNKEEESLPLVWSADEVEQLLAGTELEGTVKEDKGVMWKEWMESIEPTLLLQMHPLDAAAVEFDPSFFGFGDYLAARTLISSRSFQIDEFHGVGMVPLADLFNHKTGAEDVHLMTSPHKSESNTTQENNESDTTSTSISAIHDDDMSASITVDEGEGDDSGGEGDNGDRDNSEGGDDDDSDDYGDGDSDDYGDGDGDGDDSDGDDLEMTMVKDVKLGAEVFNTYGSLGNAALLHRYGFTEPDNPYDIVNIDLELILQWSSSLFSGQHRRARLSLWKRLDYSGCVTHNSEYFEVSFNGEPEIEMLVLLYIMLLPHDAYYKMDLALATAGSSSKPMDIIFSDKSEKLCHKTGLLSEDLLLTKSLCNALLSLADMRDSLYGTNSIEDDIEALGRCCCLSDKKLYHSLMLRISERRILQKLKMYAAKETSVRKKLKRK